VERNLRDDLTRQDSIILNLQRACEAAIDLADILASAGQFAREQAEKLRRMVGFRNVAVHDYQALSLDNVREIIRGYLDDLAAFARWAVGRAR
jgi:uncharacterized protein YutE (UPF0331/DUF86 family)